MPVAKVRRRHLGIHERKVNLAADHCASNCARSRLRRATRTPGAIALSPTPRLDQRYSGSSPCGDGDGQPGFSRVECCAGDGGTNLIEGLAHGSSSSMAFAVGVSPAVQESATGRQRGPQAAQLSADRRLAQMQAGGRLGHVLLYQQRLQSDQQIEIETPAIHEMDSSQTSRNFTDCSGPPKLVPVPERCRQSRRDSTEKLAMRKKILIVHAHPSPLADPPVRR